MCASSILKRMRDFLSSRCSAIGGTEHADNMSLTAVSRKEANRSCFQSSLGEREANNAAPRHTKTREFFAFLETAFFHKLLFVLAATTLVKQKLRGVVGSGCEWFGSLLQFAIEMPWLGLRTSSLHKPNLAQVNPEAVSLEVATRGVELGCRRIGAVKARSLHKTHGNSDWESCSRRPEITPVRVHIVHIQVCRRRELRANARV